MQKFNITLYSCIGILPQRIILLNTRTCHGADCDFRHYWCQYWNPFLTFFLIFSKRIKVKKLVLLDFFFIWNKKWKVIRFSSDRTMVKVGATATWKPLETNIKCNKETPGPECELWKFNFFSRRMEVSEVIRGFSHALKQITF